MATENGVSFYPL